MARLCRVGRGASPIDLFEVSQGDCPYKYVYDSAHQLQWIDCPYDTEALAQASTPYIVSYHDYETTPDLGPVLAHLQKVHPEASYYKIATMAQSSLDALRMLKFQREHPQVIGICMGELGCMTRILAPIVGTPIMYAPVERSESNAPGQLSVPELETIYRFHALNPTTSIYALIGHRVKHSPGHLFHNMQFRDRGVNAVYIKISLASHELLPFFEAIHDLPFHGLSVTAPFKEMVPYTSASPEVAAVGAANTLMRTSEGWHAHNTDTMALEQILSHEPCEHAVVLGAGGAARAAIHALLRLGRRVTIVNRTEDKARRLAEEFQCAYAATVPSHDLCINATSHPDPLPEGDICSGATVMELNIETTPFLQKAYRAGCRVMEGRVLFCAQAELQSHFFCSDITN